MKQGIELFANPEACFLSFHSLNVEDKSQTKYVGPLASEGDLFSVASFRTSHDNKEEITIQIREINVKKAIFKYYN